MHSFALLAALLPAFAVATEHIHKVMVGGAALAYNPESITASVGDIVEFNFYETNHTATQSAFDKPCVALEGGADSDFMPNPEGKPGVTWNFKVETEDPTWFYCKQTEGTHCGMGMVFAINALTTGDSTFADFKQLAIAQNGTGSAAPIVSGTAPPPPEKTVEMGAPKVVPGSGVSADGNTCQCSCLCEPGQLPAGAGVGGFGGFSGTVPM